MIAAAGVLYSGVAAQAADLGGDCCADLEERVAELEATTARKGNTKVSLTVYGQVSRALVWHDEDASTYEKFSSTDFAYANSRFGFKGGAKINADLSAGYRIELSVDGDDQGSIGIRHNVLYLQSESFGTIKLGRTSSATDGIAEIALAGVATMYSCDEAATTCTTAGLDGGRPNGIHYVSPTFAGFAASASWFHAGNATNTPAGSKSNDGFDVALRYANEFGAIRVAAGVGYRVTEDNIGIDDGTATLAGSASVMHVPTGLFLNVSAGQTNLESVNETTGYGMQAGIETRLSPAGKTTFELGYGVTSDDSVTPEPFYATAGVKQSIDAAAMDLFLIYKYQDLDDATLAQDDMSSVTFGAIIQF